MQTAASTAESLLGKVCLVTGATAGLGKATATALACRGATVILLGRDATRGEAVRREIAAQASHADSTGNPTDQRIHFLAADLSSQHSIRAAARQLLDQQEHLHVLVNNAAVLLRRRVVTPDGLEAMFATNHLGPFLLTTLLLDRLRASAPARIITVTAPSTTRPDFDDLQGERRFNANHAFGASKMCNVLFTYALARRLEGTGPSRVTANALHPGLFRSGLLREMPRIAQLLYSLIAPPPERAAAGVVYLATSRDVAAANGRFFKTRGNRAVEITSDAYSRDIAIQDRLWQISEQLTAQPESQP